MPNTNNIRVPESALYYTKSTTTYVSDDGEIVVNSSSEPVMIRTAADLDLLTAYEPGTFAYTAGFKKIWQKAADGTWANIVGGDANG